MIKNQQNTTIPTPNLNIEKSFNKQFISLLTQSGQNYFDALVQFLCNEAGVEYAFVGKYNPNLNKVETQSFLAKGTYVKGFEYDLKNTPCETVVGNKLSVYEKNVQQLFPLDEDLKTFGIDSYIGMPLYSLDEEPVGLIVVMDSRPLKEIEHLTQILSLIKSKTELELERLFLKKNKLLSHKDFVKVFQNFQDVFFLVHYNENNEQIDVTMSPSVEQVLGYTAEEIDNLDFTDFYLSPDERNDFIETLKVEKQVKNYSLRLKKKNGNVIHVEFDTEFVTEDLPKNAAFSLRGVLRDVTSSYKENLRFEIAYLIDEKSQQKSVSLTSLLEYMHAVLKGIISVPNFYVALLDDEHLFFPYFEDKVDQFYDSNSYRPFEKDGLTEYVIAGNNIINYTREELLKLEKKNKLKIRGEMPEKYIGIPLKSEGVPIGAMVIQSYDKDDVFLEEDIGLLKFIASQIGRIIDRKLWQDKLIQNEEYFRALVENSSEIIGVLDENGKVEYISESVHRILGYRTEELLGENIGDTIDLLNIPFLLKEKTERKDEVDVLKVFDKKGSKKYLEISLNHYKKNSVIFNAKDITSRVAVEKKRERIRKRLIALHQVERTLISNKSLIEVLDDTLKVIINNVLDVSYVNIGFLHHDKKELEIIALNSKEWNSTLVKKGDFLPFKELSSIKSILKKKPFHVNDISKLKTATQVDTLNKKQGFLSYYIKPIIINDKVIGTFCFASDSKNYFEGIDEELIQEITLLVAVVINDAILKEELAQREDDLTTIFNSSNEGILKLDPDGKFLVVNKELCKMLGYSEKELLTKTFVDITYKDDLKMSNHIFKDIRSKKAGSYSFEKRYQHKNGSILNCRVSVRSVYDANNEFEYSIAFIYDETVRKQALRQVTNLRKALNHSAAVFFTDPKGKIVDINKKLEVLSGYSKEELIGASANIFNSNYHTREEWREMWNVISKGDTWQSEIRNQHKNGSLYWVFETISPILNYKGNIENFISIQFDITEEIKAKTNLIREVIEAQEHERERFAMEIHDGLGQMLLASKMNLQAIKDNVNSIDDNTSGVFNKTIDLLGDAVFEARSISHGLMSRVLNRFGLAYAVNDIVNNINATQKIDFTFKHNIENKRFNEEVEMGLYRTLQELTNNITKHAQATQASLTIAEKAGRLEVEIKDNGVGIERGTINNKNKAGIGLKNMNSRIQYLGGTFIINDKIKKGTKINISLSI